MNTEISPLPEEIRKHYEMILLHYPIRILDESGKWKTLYIDLDGKKAHDGKQKVDSLNSPMDQEN